MTSEPETNDVGALYGITMESMLAELSSRGRRAVKQLMENGPYDFPDLICRLDTNEQHLRHTYLGTKGLGSATFRQLRYYVNEKRQIHLRAKALMKKTDLPMACGKYGITIEDFAVTFSGPIYEHLYRLITESGLDGTITKIENEEKEYIKRIGQTNHRRVRDYIVGRRALWNNGKGRGGEQKPQWTAFCELDQLATFLGITDSTLKLLPDMGHCQIELEGRCYYYVPLVFDQIKKHVISCNLKSGSMTPRRLYDLYREI